MVRLSVVSVSLWRLRPPLKVVGPLFAFLLKLITAPRMPTSAVAHNSIHPVCPLGMTVEKFGAVRGKLSESSPLNWQLLGENWKL